MNKYKVIYWLAGDLRVAYLEAKDIEEAFILFYLNYTADDVVEVSRVQ